MTTNPSSTETVRAIIIETLGLGDRAQSVDSATPLFGSMPELDSLAVLDLVTGLEERFDLVIDDSEITEDIFFTVGSLAAFIDEKQART